MNPTKTLRTLVLIAFSACALVGATHGLLAAAACWLAFEFCVARPLPGCGTNTLGTTAATQILVQEALDLVFTIRPILKEITTDLSDASAKQGQAIVTRTLGIPTVQNFGSAATARADTDVSVTIDQFKEVKYTFTRAEYNASSRDLIRESAMPLAVSVANHLVDAISALWISGNFTNSTTLANGWDYNHLVAVRQALVARGVPDTRKFYVSNDTVYAALLQDPMVVAAQNNPNNGGAIGSGKLPMVAGFALAEYPALPTTGNMVAFAGTADSTVLAARVPTDPRSVFGADVPLNGTFDVVTHSSGLSVVVNNYIDQTSWDVTTRLAFCYGVAKGNANNGQLIVTA